MKFSSAKRRRPEMERDDEVESLSDISGAELSEVMSTGVEERADAEVSQKSKRIKRGHPGRRFDHDSMNGPYVGEVYKSNIFKLQVDELLASVKPKFTRFENALASLLQTLKSIIEAIPGRDPVSISEAEKQFNNAHKVTIPFPDPRPKVDTSYMLHYSKPEHVNVAGSYPLQTTTKSGEFLTVDLIVTMPRSIFQDKDYLNYRYFAKRAYYLASIAAGIKANETQRFKMHFEYLHGVQYLPILVLHPTFDQNSKQDIAVRNCHIRILPVLAQNVFAEEKLGPSRTCVRSKSQIGADGQPRPTPLYNASIIHDSHVTSYLRLQYDLIKTSDKYREACILGRVWLKQRGFSSRIEHGGFGNFEWAVLMGLLLRGGGPKGKPLFSPGYSSYQLFKATVQFLAAKDLIITPQIVGTSKSAADVKSNGSPLFFDAQRNHNILFKMSPWSYRLLRHEAEVTLASLKASTFDQFESTFILRADVPLCRYDALIEVPVIRLLEREGPQDAKHQKAAHEYEALYNTLNTALGTRVTLVNIRIPESETWALDRSSKGVKVSQKLVVGFIFDAAQINRAVDHGPSADAEKEASQFRKFWGEKAELRRFKDGSILESLVWDTKSDSRSLFRQIVSYSIIRHYGEEVAKELHFHEGLAAQILTQPTLTASSDTAAFQPLVQAFESLTQTLRDLEDTPLRISEVVPADSQLAYSSIHLPFSQGRPQMAKPANGVIRFEGSARWPDDVHAIQRTKVAFLLALGESLEAKNLGYNCRVGLENANKPLLNQTFLDVTDASGVAIRLRIHHDREAALFESQLKNKTLTSQEKLDVGFALAMYKQQYLYLPAHCQAVQALATRHPYFSPTLRLVKQWFSSHLLSSHFADALIEMFAARAFTNPFPWEAPSSAATGLFRTLIFLSRWDWHTEPWIVTLGSEDMAESEVTTISTRFEAWRKIDPALNRVVLFAASNVDQDGTTWTDHSRPPKVVAGRMTHLAKAAVEAIKKQSLGLDIRSLFVSDYSDYDFVLHMNTEATQTSKKQKITNSQVFKNFELEASMNPNAVGFDPYDNFVRDLEELFSNAVVLFHDAERKDRIAGLWHPRTKRSWKLKLGYSSAPDTKNKRAPDVQPVENDVIDVNRVAILNEIARIGGSLISKIEEK